MPQGAEALLATGVGTAFGTFGEFLQGTDVTGTRFMVTSPLAAWSTAIFRYLPDASEIRVVPAHKSKSARIAAATLRHAGIGGGGELNVRSDLPEGKGLASSSADLVATIRAVNHALGHEIAADQVEALMRAVEPSDGVMYDEIVDFDYVNVRLRERLGTLPSLTIVAHDEGGQVDTVRYNRVVSMHTPAERREYSRLLETMREAIKNDDLTQVGHVATRSAELNDRRTPRRHLHDLVRLARDVDALGVVRAHSGTMLGILIDDADREVAAKVTAVLDGCRALSGTTSVQRSLGRNDEWCRPGLLSAHPTRS